MSTLDCTWNHAPFALDECTMLACKSVLQGPTPVAVLGVGSTEPHGPHLPLITDALLARESSLRAARALRGRGVSAVAAPVLSYGVTRYARDFAGAVSIDEDALVGYLSAVCVGLRDAGFALVCVTNHHLEPEHVSAVSRAVERAQTLRGPVIFANQLTKRWGRTLSDEFKRGACHAGSYESSLVLAARADLVRDELRLNLEDVPISLSVAMREGKADFLAMGLTRAYAGEPSRATPEEGEQLYGQLVEMIVTECLERLETDGLRPSAP
ncbi:MAG: creatininase family protein [Deltaproteobacteria bacterium]|nr:creatininase family protein [Deltaproteobacteria bacterium]